ncbi:hypothetical protein LZC95_04510 [Pendulispora brunnea]|uniref:DUF308 domain-containing protein n=1 Tax=Pendulispora brunnea TaxID=2905690 RepID=A0ABZ2KBU9_9BACT
MQNYPDNRVSISPSNRWLKSYYFVGAAVSTGWLVAALALGKSAPTLSAVLLVAYPAWDAIANFLDAHKSGGRRANLSQTLNLVISIITAICVGVALGVSMNAAFGAFYFLVSAFWLTFKKVRPHTAAVHG